MKITLEIDDDCKWFSVTTSSVKGIYTEVDCTAFVCTGEKHFVMSKCSNKENENE